jgi:RHS repeat-associated protein
MEYSDYYPDGMRFWTSTSNSAALPYRYNGKELEAMNGLNEYDYGARRREPGIPVWTTLDPLAEKYYSISPYVYCKGNPVRFVDLHGDSLTVSANTGNTTALNTFETIENSSMGGFYTLGKSGTGKYTLNSTGKTGTMTAEEQASYDMLNTIISNPKDAKFVVVDGNDAISSSIMVGDNGTATGITATPGVHTIDVGDANQFGTTGLLTAQGAIGHELSEGFDIQVNGAKPNSAHFNTGIPTENKINGTISGGATINPNGSITVSVTYNGKTKIVTIIFTNGNIGVGGVTNNIKYMIIGFYT